jgi:hypothetical protein
VGSSPEPAEPIGKLQDPLFLALLWVNCPATSRDCSARCQVHPRSSSAPEGPEVCRLTAGGSRIRTLGPRKIDEVMIVKLRILSPAGERQVSHKPAMPISRRLASAIA